MSEETKPNIKLETIKKSIDLAQGTVVPNLAHKWFSETIEHFETCPEKDNCRTVWDFRLFLDENDVEFEDPFEGQ